MLVALPLILGFPIGANSWAQRTADAATASNTGQQASALSWIEIPGRDNQFYMAQQTQDGTLVLTANECFFPKLGLACL